jgi:hypothetical protein
MLLEEKSKSTTTFARVKVAEGPEVSYQNTCFRNDIHTSCRGLSHSLGGNVYHCVSTMEHGNLRWYHEHNHIHSWRMIFGAKTWCQEVLLD